MSKIIQKPISVVSRVDDSSVPADLMVCPCGSDVWHVYIVNNHPHMQCIVCGVTYCQGGDKCGIEGLQSHTE